MTRIGSLFSGYGGLDMGTQAVLGGHVAWHCEYDRDASKILAHHWPDTPNLGDITAVDWTRVEPVDVVTGGFPCQDVSTAGKRLGLKPGTRSGLWSHFAYAIAQLRPALVVIENVGGLLSAKAHSDLEPCPWCVGDDESGALRALGAVLGDLAALRYDARWCRIRAADAGAPHGRARVFIVATDTADPRCQTIGRGAFETSAQLSGVVGDYGVASDADDGRCWQPDPQLGRLPIAHTDGDNPTPDTASDGRHERRAESARLGSIRSPDERGATPTDTNSDALRQQPVTLTGGSSAPVTGLASAEAAAHTDCDGQQGVRRQQLVGRDVDGCGGADIAWGDYEPAIRRWEHVLGRLAPPPTEPGAKGQPRLSPRFVEWLMGLPAGHVTDVGISRNAQLKALGNGVVPQQAELALQWLLWGEWAGIGGCVMEFPTPTTDRATNRSGARSVELLLPGVAKALTGGAA